MAQTFPANTTTGNYLSVDDMSIALKSSNTISNTSTVLSLDTEHKNVFIESNDGDSDNTAAVRSSISVRYDHVSLYGRDKTANTRAFLGLQNGPNDKRVGVSSIVDDGTDVDLNNYPNSNVVSYTHYFANNAEGSSEIAAQDFASGNKSSVVASHVDKNVVISAEDTSASTKSSINVRNDNYKQIFIEAANTVSNTRSHINVTDSNTDKAIHMSVESDGGNTMFRGISIDNTETKQVVVFSANNVSNTYSAAEFKDEEISIQSSDDNNNSRSTVWISNKDAGANTRTGITSSNSDDPLKHRHAFLYSRDDRSGANTRSGLTINDTRKLSLMYALKHDGTQEWNRDYPTNSNVITFSAIAANNESGVTNMVSTDYVNNISTSVEASYANKNVVLSAEDTSASTKSSVVVQNDQIYMQTDDDNTSLRSSISIEDKNVDIFSRNEGAANTAAHLSVNAGGYVSAALRTRDHVANKDSYVDVNRANNVKIAVENTDADTQSIVNVGDKSIWLVREYETANNANTQQITIDDEQVYIESTTSSDDNNDDIISALAINRENGACLIARNLISNTEAYVCAIKENNRSVSTSFEHDGTTNVYTYFDNYPNSGHIISYAHIDANNNAGKIEMLAEDFTTNVKSSIEVNHVDKNVVIEAKDNNANTRSKFSVGGDENNIEAESKDGNSNTLTKFSMDSKEDFGENSRIILGEIAIVIDAENGDKTHAHNIVAKIYSPDGVPNAASNNSLLFSGDFIGNDTAHTRVYSGAMTSSSTEKFPGGMRVVSAVPYQNALSYMLTTGDKIEMAHGTQTANTVGDEHIETGTKLEITDIEFHVRSENENANAIIAAKNGDNIITAYLNAEDFTTNALCAMGVNATDKLAAMAAFEYDGTTDMSIDYPTNSNVVSYSYVVANNEIGTTSVGAENYASGIKSSIEASHVDKNVVIAVEDTSARTKSIVGVDNGEFKEVYITREDESDNTRSQISVKDKQIYTEVNDANTSSLIAITNNIDDYRHVIVVSRDDTPGIDSISALNVDDKDKEVTITALKLDGTTHWPDGSYSNTISYTHLRANNDMGATELAAQNFSTGIKSSVTASYVDKSVVLQVQDINAHSDSDTLLEMTKPGVFIKSTGNQLTDTLSSLEVSDEKQNIYMVAKDETDGTRSTINVNNRDDNKRVFITARNDNTGTRSVIEVSNKEERVYLEASDSTIKSLVDISRKNKNVAIEVKSEKSATSLQVTDEQVTINGARVLTQNDLDALRPPSRRSIFGWFVGR